MGGNKLVDFSAEQYEAECKKRSEIQIELWKSRSREQQAKATSETWNKRSSDEVKGIADKISHTLKNKTQAQRDETYKKRRATISKRPIVTCPHCGLTRRYSNNMDRYHFDNCKRRLS